MKPKSNPKSKSKSPAVRKTSRLPAVDPIAKARSAAVARRSARDAALLAVIGGSPAIPTQGKIRLDIAGATPATVMAITLTAREGMTDNSYYPDDKEHVDALTASYNGLRARADLIASLEQQLKTARLAEEAETLNSKDIVRAAARYCESADNTDEGLASAGWNLRRPPSPSVVLPAPDRLVLKSTAFPGVMTARWRRVTNFRFYEIQMVVLDQASAAPDWENVPFRSNTLSSDTFPKADIGQRMYVRVRTVGSKGASPWSQEVVAMVL